MQYESKPEGFGGGLGTRVMLLTLPEEGQQQAQVLGWTSTTPYISALHHCVKAKADTAAERGKSYICQENAQAK